MQHWFDALVKRAAGGGLSRREAIVAGLAAGAGAAAARGGLIGRAVAATLTVKPEHVLAGQAAAHAEGGSSCTRHRVGGALVTKVSTSSGGFTLQQHLSFDLKDKSGAVTITFSRGDAPIAKMHASLTAGGAVTASFTYGRAMRGIKTAAVQSEGATFKGTVDGRPFTASRTARSLAEARFSDAARAPQIAVDADVQAAFRSLTEQLPAAFKLCRTSTAPVHASKSLKKPRALSTLKGGGKAPGAPGQQVMEYTTQRNYTDGSSYYQPISIDDLNVPSCHDCLQQCDDDWCKGFAGAWITSAIPPLEVLGLAGYVATLISSGGCTGGCFLPGSGCNAVPCGAGYTCTPGDKCMPEAIGPANNVCCPQALLVCGSQCCREGITKCAPDGGCGCVGQGVPCGNQCCDSGKTCCGTKCCDSASVCCGDDCCAPGMCHNGRCCASICGDTCCPPLNACCNGVCCPGNAQCIGGKCCSQTRSCGPVCCPEGQTCADARTGQCSAGQKCGLTQRACRSQTGPNQWVTVCCPMPLRSIEATCCQGKCCAPFEVCCYNKQAGRTDCWDSNLCDRPR